MPGTGSPAEQQPQVAEAGDPIAEAQETPTTVNKGDEGGEIAAATSVADAALSTAKAKAEDEKDSVAQGGAPVVAATEFGTGLKGPASSKGKHPSEESDESGDEKHDGKSEGESEESSDDDDKEMKTVGKDEEVEEDDSDDNLAQLRRDRKSPTPTGRFVMGLDCHGLTGPMIEIMEASKIPRLTKRFYDLMVRAGQLELGNIEHETLFDYHLSNDLAPEQVWEALRTKYGRLTDLFDTHGGMLKGVRLPVIPAAPSEYGAKKKTLWCIRCDKTLGVMGDGYSAHCGTQYCKDFRTKKGLTYAEGDRANIICGWCGMMVSPVDWCAYHRFGACKLDLRRVTNEDGSQISSLREALRVVAKIVTGEVEHPSRVERRKAHQVRDQQQKQELTQQQTPPQKPLRAMLKPSKRLRPKTPDRAPPGRQPVRLTTGNKDKTTSKGSFPRERSVCTPAPKRSRSGLRLRSTKRTRRTREPSSSSSSYSSQARLRAKRGLAAPDRRSKPGRSAQHKRRSRTVLRGGQKPKAHARQVEDAPPQKKSRRDDEILKDQQHLQQQQERAEQMRKKLKELEDQNAQARQLLTEKREKQREKQKQEQERKRIAELEARQKFLEEEKMRIANEEALQRQASLQGRVAVKSSAPTPIPGQGVQPKGIAPPPPPTPMKQPKTSKEEEEVPFIEQLGEIRWENLQPRERDQMRTACLLLATMEEHVRRAEADKTTILRMMSHDRSSQVQDFLRSAASSSSTQHQ